jgi:hypothetical protein
MKSRRVAVAEHVGLGTMRNACRYFVESLKGKDHIKDLNMDENIGLELISNKLTGSE